MSSSEVFRPLRLKKKEERRIKMGHPWVYSNEIDTGVSPLKEFSAGEVVEIQDHQGHTLGTGYINPHSLICARLVSRDPKHPFSASVIVHRINVALSLRERLYAEPYYRLVFGESDGLPGLVIDRFGDVCVVQVSTAGMELMIEAIAEALDKIVKPTAIWLRNDSSIRKQEGLESYVRCLSGDCPDATEIIEHGLRFRVPMGSGQKTGWFYDQRDNRKDLAPYVKGGRVLDVFSYLGGWGLQSVAQGAASALCVDDSATALEGVLENAELNNLQDQVMAMKGDAFDVLKALHADGERFDVVVVDPPAFIKRRKDMKNGLNAYRRINELAMRLIDRDGFLISCSCSYHLSREQLMGVMQGSARHIDRDLQILAHGYQSMDHPMHPAIAETAYLKVVYSRVTRR
jgi:23S rRNA (cytosine1962-C5)-methyltransferase